MGRTRVLNLSQVSTGPQWLVSDTLSAAAVQCQLHIRTERGTNKEFLSQRRSHLLSTRRPNALSILGAMNTTLSSVVSNIQTSQLVPSHSFCLRLHS